MKKFMKKNVKSGSWSKKNKKDLSIKLKKGDSAAGVIFIFKIRTPQL